MNTSEITRLLTLIQDTVNAAHPDPEDDTGAIVHNACLAIAEELGLEL